MKTVGLGVRTKDAREVDALSARVEELEKENADLKDEVELLKKKSRSSVEKKAKAEADPDKDVGKA